MGEVYFNGSFYALDQKSFHDTPTLVFSGPRDLCIAFMVESRHEDRTIEDARQRGDAWERGEIAEWVLRMFPSPGRVRGVKEELDGS